jgi:hypothetical protein
VLQAFPAEAERYHGDCMYDVCAGAPDGCQIAEQFAAFCYSNGVDPGDFRAYAGCRECPSCNRIIDTSHCVDNRCVF